MAAFPIPVVDSNAPEPWRGKRDTTRPVVLIGFLRQGNLGIGYLSATLRQFGYRVEVLDFESDTDELVAAVRRVQPIVVGFSLIFQFYVKRFAAVAEALRDAGVDCHFTIGGHFPSLSSEDTLKHMPQIDSIVRYEGELTLLELADRASTGGDWKDVPGIAYRDESGGCRITAPRHLIHDLDTLPWPDREYEPESILGQRAMPLLASRGCSRTCSFCSIHVFYRAAPGKVVRLQPIVVGFSLIFQFYVKRFAAVAEALRDAGVACHFTIGGHFPSLSSEDTLRHMPQVDSIVRYEGEL
ncbi:MAG: cobalamin-dependent protein, partial [Caldimonas sp.]